MTAFVDMFPQQLRKRGRRELLILGISVVCYLVGLLLVTEVSVVSSVWYGHGRAELQGTQTLVRVTLSSAVRWSVHTCLASLRARL